ncbi:uncharacterized protein [Aristolochia californica]|uniref:uncharacterized protein n=1 Tax=Aristolochia californica TaxID=171875 RepID=UPI0035DEC35B
MPPHDPDLAPVPDPPLAPASITLRRSTCPSRPPDRYVFSSTVSLVATLSSISIPSCYKQAMAHECWQKLRSDGSLDQYKARLIALGKTQKYGIDYEYTFALVAKMTIVRTILAIASSQSWHLHQIDLKNAFMHGDLQEDIYMKLPSGDALISWKCKKQDRVSKSSTEADYRAMSTTSSEIIWLRGLLEELEFPQTTSTPLHADNTSAIQTATNLVFHERTKHIEVDCHSIRDTLEHRVISLPYISLDLQVANVFTKAMTQQRHNFLVGKLLLVDLPTSI